jgi:beta-glucosidase
LQPGETQQVRFTLHPRQMSLVDADGNRSVEPRRYSVFVGGQQPSPNVGVSETFSIQGSQPLPR